MKKKIPPSSLKVLEQLKINHVLGLLEEKVNLVSLIN